MNLSKFNCFLLLISLVLIQGCQYRSAYDTPVFQGKQIEDKSIVLIKPGMTKDEIKYIFGSPDIIDTFDPNKFIYMNTYKKHIQYTTFDQLYLIMSFNNQDKLIGIYGNYFPPTKDPIFN